jgi:hypothetical protein
MTTIGTTGQTIGSWPAQRAVVTPRGNLQNHRESGKTASGALKFGSDPGTIMAFYSMLAGFGALGGLVGTLAWLSHRFDPDPPQVRKLRKALKSAALKKKMADPEFWASHPMADPYDPKNPFNKGWKL